MAAYLWLVPYALGVAVCCVAVALSSWLVLGIAWALYAGAFFAAVRVVTR